MDINEVFLGLIREGRSQLKDDLDISDDGSRVENACVSNVVFRAALLLIAAEERIPFERIEMCLGQPLYAVGLSEAASLLLIPRNGDGAPIDAEIYMHRIEELIRYAAMITNRERLLEEDDELSQAARSTETLFRGLPMLVPDENLPVLAFEIVLLTTTQNQEFDGEDLSRLIRLLSLDQLVPSS